MSLLNIYIMSANLSIVWVKYGSLFEKDLKK
jgi:hypothetical protein